MTGAILRPSCLAVALVLTASPVAAHHSRTIYDQERSITIEGVVTEFEWSNPHVYLYVETQTDGGDARVWAIEHGSTTGMRRRGWTRDILAPGDRVTVQANPARDSARNMALVVSVQKAGVNLYGGGSFTVRLEEGVEGPVEAEGLSGTWMVEPLPLYQSFSRPFSWPLTEKGAQARDGYDDETMNPQLECRARTAPWFMVFPSVQRIEIGDDVVSISSEYDAIERTVHMNIASHEGVTPRYQGHSIGWWEGEALVVDTTHFSDHRSGNARGVPSGSQKHLVERFELNPDRTSLTYRFELEDPEYLAEPVRGEVRSSYRPDLEFAPVECDLENARRFLED